MPALGGDGQRKGGGGRKSYALPKAKKAPRSTGPKSEVAAGSGYGLGKANAFKKTAPYRGAVRAAYDAQPVKQRSATVRAIKRSPTLRAMPENQVLTQTHSSRMRGLHARKAFESQFTGMDNFSRAREENYKFGHDTGYALNELARYQAQTNPRFTGMSSLDRMRVNNFVVRQPGYADSVYGQELARARRHRDPLGGLGATARATDPNAGKSTLVAAPDKTALLRTQARLSNDMATAGVSGDQIASAINKLSHSHETYASKIMRQFTRGSSATAQEALDLLGGHAGRALSGESLVKGAVSNKADWSQVIKKLGGGKTLQHTGGFAADVAFDPLTYLTLGTGDVALGVGKAAKFEALAQGATEADALELGKQIYNRARDAGLNHQGLRIGARGLPVRAATMARRMLKGEDVATAFRNSAREVSTNGKLSARYVSRPVAATGRMFAPKGGKLDTLIGDVATQLNHSHMPAGMHPVEFDHIRHAARELRAGRGRAEVYALRRAETYRKLLKQHGVTKDGEHRITLSVDNGTWRNLADPGERAVAERVVADVRRLGEAEVANGIRDAGTLRAHYFPRLKREVYDEIGSARPTRGSMGERISGDSMHQRTEHRPLAALTPEELSGYVTNDIVASMARRLGDSHRAAALKNFHDRLGAMGEVLPHYTRAPRAQGFKWDQLYVRDGRGWKPLISPHDSPEKAARKIEQAQKPDYTFHRPGKEIRVIPEHAIEHAWQQATRGRGVAEGVSTPGRFFDRIQGPIKTGQTVINPGYHGTNFIGDVFNARLGGARLSAIPSAYRLARVGVKTKRLASDLEHDPSLISPHHIEAAVKNVEHYGRNGELSDAEVVLLFNHFAGDMGQAGNELRVLRQHEHLQTGAGKAAAVRRGGTKGMDAVRNFNEFRESIPRLLTFREALKRGIHPRDAAAWVQKHHFDYSDLTETERVFLRRAIPFYTFAARNTPLQVASLVKQPGRYATVQKARDQLAGAEGLGRDWASGLPRYAQDQVPFAVPLHLPGTGDQPLALNLKLPLNDISRIDPGGFKDQILSNMSEVVREPFTQITGYNPFFGEQHTGRTKLMPAPSWAPALDKLGLIPGKVGSMQDRRSGKPVPFWSWRVDDLARLVPLVSNLAINPFTPGQSHHAKSSLGAGASLLGPRMFPIEPDQAAIQDMLNKRAHLIDVRDQLKATVLHHHSGDKWGGKIKKLNKQISSLEGEVAAATSNYSNPLFAKPKKKGRAHKLGAGTFGSGKSGTFGSGASFKP